MKAILLSIISLVTFFGFSQNFTSFFPTQNSSGLYFGRSVKINSNNQVLVSSLSFVPMNSVGRSFLFQINDLGGIDQQESFLPADVLISDAFGEAIGIDNDKIVIGAPFHDENATNAGAVYFYKKTGETWLLSQKITPDDFAEDDHFGKQIYLHENFLFISAIGNNGTGAGAIYVYQYDGTQWQFSQKLINTAISTGGTTMKVDNDLLVISTGNNGNRNFITYALQNDIWTFQTDLTVIGMVSNNNYDFGLENNMLYVTTPNLSEKGIQIYALETSGWIFQELLITPEFGDHFFSSIEVKDDTMFFGSDSYMLLVGRKFHLMYYKKTSNVWEFQNQYYGNGPSGIDDAFGSSFAFNDENIVVGAPIEGVFSNGNAYYRDINSLSTKTFTENSVSIYPNPVRNEITVNFDGIEVISKAAIYQLDGKKIKEFKTGFERIDVSKLQAGLYLLTLEMSNGATITKKFSKE